MLTYKIFSVLIFFLLIVFGACGGSETKTSPAIAPDPAVSVKDEKMELLQRVTVGLPDEMRQSILADKAGFIKQLSIVMDLPEKIFIQADKQHSLGADYNPEDIVMLTDYPELVLSRNNHSLCEVLIPDLLLMVEEAGKEGLTLVISSTYRSYEYQGRVFKWNVEQNGLETAERESARPGTSQHQLGMAIDFGTITDDYAFTPAGMWLLENGWKYGFSLSYPNGYEDLTGYRYECWHFRYITKAGTELQRKYFGDIQHYLITFLNEHKESLINMF